MNKNKEILTKEKKINTEHQTIESLKLTLIKNKKNSNDIQLRALAQIENIKKNTNTKKEQIINIENQIFFEKISPVINYVKEILETAKKENVYDTPEIKGIEMTFQSLSNIMLKFGIPIDHQKK